jgi:hypothetical protein
MDEIKIPEGTKDLITVISETNIIILDLNDHLKVLFQNVSDLKNDVYSKKIQTVHLSFLLRALIENIENLTKKGSFNNGCDTVVKTG